MEKTAAKNTKYSRYETILKIGPLCKGYRLCKMVSLGENFKWPKMREKRFYKDARFVLCKKPLEKTPNIREMRPF